MILRKDGNMRYAIAGAGHNGKIIAKYLRLSSEDDIVCFFDNDTYLCDKGSIEGIRVLPFSKMVNEVFDKIIISQDNPSVYEEVYHQILETTDKDSIIIHALSPIFIEAFSDQRTRFIKDFAAYSRSRMGGNVAECGVFRGDSAKYINKYFYDRKLYLFDTFEGFDNDDLSYDKKASFGFRDDFFNMNTFVDTTIDTVMHKMVYPDQIVIKKGRFPDTATDIDDRFCFVNLDMDLFQPMYAGLVFFYDRMVNGGCILLHDYFHPGLEGVKAAVEEYEKSHGIILVKTPIGDGLSIAIIKD